MRIPRIRVRTEHAVAVGGVLLVFAAGLLFAPRPKPGGDDAKETTQGSSRHPTPAGGKAFYTLLRRLGLPVQRHERRIELLPREATVLMLLSIREVLDKDETAWLKGWVARGGTAVWAPRRGRDADPVIEAFGLTLVPGEGTSELTATLEPLGGERGGAYTLSFPGGSRLKPATPSRPLAEDARGAAALVVDHGQGRLIALASPDFASNAGLDRADHAAFLVHLAALAGNGGTAYFDEYHHGFRGGHSAMAIVLDTPLAWTIALLSAAGVCAIVATGRRLGPPILLHEERRRRPGEFIDAFAGLCRRQRAGSQAAAMVLAEFQMYLQRAHGCGDPRAAGRLEARAGLPAGSLEGILDRGRRLARGAGANEPSLAAWGRDLEALRGRLRVDGLTRRMAR